MEREKIKTLAIKYKIPLVCFKFYIIYFISLSIAKHSKIFNAGYSGDIFTVLVISVLIIYRFLSIISPAFIFLWIIKLFCRENKT
jgi:hypothetical protein